MRPHEHKKTATSRGVAAVQMHINDRLWWLRGYPAGRRWEFVPDSARDPASMTLEGRDLRRASYGLRKLRGEFPRALPRVVGDGPAWVAGVEAVLAAVKPLVHGGVAPPASLIADGLYSRAVQRSAAELDATLAPLIGALSYCYATEPKRLGKALRFCADLQADLVSVVGRSPGADAVRTAVQVVHLGTKVGAAAMRPLVRLLARSDASTVPMLGGASDVERMIKRIGTGQAPARGGRPAARLGREVLTWVRWSLGRPAKTVKSFLRLLAASDVAGLLEAWASWWPAVDRYRSKAADIAGSLMVLRTRMESLEKVRKRLQAHKSRAPASLDARALTASLRGLAEVGGAIVSSTVKVLDGLDGDAVGTGDRCAMLVHIGNLAQPATDREPRRLGAVLRGLLRYVRAVGDQPGTLAPWLTVARKEAANNRPWTSVSDDLLDCDFPRARISDFFVAMERLAHHRSGKDATGKVLSQLAHRVIDVLPATGDVERTLLWVKLLAEGGEADTWRPPGRYAATLAVLGDDQQVVDVLRACDRLAGDCEVPIERLFEAILPALAGSRPALVALLLGGDLSSILSCGRRLALLDALDVKVALEAPGAGEDRSWIEQYPDELAGSLGVLAIATAEAAASAARITSSVLTSVDALNRQREAIAEKVAGGEPDTEATRRLEKRLANIEKRIATPAVVSPAKLESLALKIHRRAAILLLAAVETQIEETLEKTLGRLIGIESAPAWLRSDEVMRVLGAAIPRPSCRALALDLLRTRAGNRPWDLRERPQNQAFLADLRQRGVDVDVWLDGFGPRRVGRGESAVTLALEEDPLEVFQMGQHFNTCLSIGACNFFSVFSNAADVNKRVIYGRDREGQVVGRRLVCISESGHLVAFRAYAHTADASFERHSAAYIRDLAEAMGTQTAPSGTIEPLVSPDWYDDGAIDIAGRFDFLEHNSLFRRQLATVKPEALELLIASAVGRPRIDGVLAPMLLHLDEVQRRPDLAEPLARLLSEPDEMPGPTCMAMFALLMADGRTELAGAMFATALETHVRRSYRQHHQWLDRAALGMLAGVAPSRTLRLMRELRPRGAGRRTTPADPQLQLITAQCYVRLHRRAQARRLLTSILTSNDAWAIGQARATLATL